MLSTEKYREADLKYINLCNYVESHPKISEDNKKKMKEILEHYKLHLLFMAEEEVKEIIDKCIRENSSMQLKKEMHNMGDESGEDYRDNDCLYNSDDTYDKDDDEYYI